MKAVDLYKVGNFRVPFKVYWFEFTLNFPCSWASSALAIAIYGEGNR